MPFRALCRNCKSTTMIKSEAEMGLYLAKHSGHQASFKVTKDFKVRTKGKKWIMNDGQ